MKVPIDQHQLCKLRELALHNGTLESWSLLAIEYSQQAANKVAELERQLQYQQARHVQLMAESWRCGFDTSQWYWESRYRHEESLKPWREINRLHERLEAQAVTISTLQTDKRNLEEQLMQVCEDLQAATRGSVRTQECSYCKGTGLDNVAECGMCGGSGDKRP